MGDAAGLADPITGEGITSAILSGLLAARALAAGSREEEEVKLSYESALSRTLTGELRLGRILAKLVYDYPTVLTRFLAPYGQELIEAVTDVVSGKKTYKEILSDPANYFRLFKVWFERRNLECSKIPSGIRKEDKKIRPPFLGAGG